MKFAILLYLTSTLLFAQSTFIDERDGTSYEYTQLGDLYWMAENLRYDAKGSVCLTDCDIIRFYSYEYVDNICPNGWRLPSMNEWEAFIKSFTDAEKVIMLGGKKKKYRVDFREKYNIFKSNALNIEPYGRMEGGKLGYGDFIDFLSFHERTDDRFHMHIEPHYVTGHWHKHHLNPSKPEKYRLFAVRCVCESIPE